MKKRSPKSALGSGRAEDDEYEITKGVLDGYTTGGEIEITIKNKDVRKSDYENIKHIPRPSHADYASYVKYGVIPSGGGMFSARMTAPVTVAGVICEAYLKSLGITVGARLKTAGDIRDDEINYADVNKDLLDKLNSMTIPMINSKSADKIPAFIEKLRKDKDSSGGAVQCFVAGMHAGLADGLFGSIEAKISELIYSIPAVKAVSFGLGQDFEKSYANEVNDEFYYDENKKVKTYTNNTGGILGGISSGMPIVINVVFKPAPSIERPQRTVDLKTGENTEITVNGRHDVLIALRGLQAVRAYVCIAIADMMLSCKKDKTDVENLRYEIDLLDAQLAELFNKRLNTAAKIGEIKKLRGLETVDKSREYQVINNALFYADEDNKPFVKEYIKHIISLSTKKQKPEFKRLCLIGKNIDYSLSPLIHGIMLDCKKISGAYTLCDMENFELDRFFEDFAYDGANVTIPYKTDVMKYCDRISDEARAIGAVNTIVKKDGLLHGYNTDAYGFEKLLDINKIDVSGKTAVILGSGGAQNAVRYALIKAGANVITASRNNKGDGIISYIELKNIEKINCLINATPLGSGKLKDFCPADDDTICKSDVIIDLNYSPYYSVLLKKGLDKGKKCVNGIDMLIYQAILAERIFLGINAEDLYEKIKTEITKSINRESI
ncbi:MAG: chorismate synthase [Eubacteriaceae bacterium]|nr:chorismate synthase [Eubacteriaceae bacterium]